MICGGGSFISGAGAQQFAKRGERGGDVAERFMTDPRDVSPGEVTEAKETLTSMRYYDDALAPIRGLRIDWREQLAPERDIPPAPREF